MIKYLCLVGDHLAGLRWTYLFDAVKNLVYTSVGVKTCQYTLAVNVIHDFFHVRINYLPPEIRAEQAT